MFRYSFGIFGCLWVVCLTNSAVADVFNMPAGQASLQFVTVRDVGNIADSSSYGFGSVDYIYRMGTYDVTVSQYCQFLNSVAKNDQYGLYDINMANLASSGPGFVGCGISRSGSLGNWTYTTTGNPNLPVNFVSWGSAARFCNWLQNGQPVGEQGVGTTETGAYTLDGETTNLWTQVRNAEATYFLPSQDEWWKAAYYKTGSTDAGYWTYTTRSNTAPENTLPDTGNNANYHYFVLGDAVDSYTDPVNYLTPVDSFPLSTGPYGTFEMGGNVFQWSETLDLTPDIWGQCHARCVNGGSYMQNVFFLDHSYMAMSPYSASSEVGFRVASSLAPEPSGSAMLLAAATGGLLGCIRRYRRG